MAGISARYWRIYVSDDNGGIYTQLAELFLANGGVDYTTSGKTYLGTTPFSGSPGLSVVFDNVIGGNGQYAYWHNSQTPFTCGIDYGSAIEVDSVGVAVSTFFSLPECPKDFIIQYSSDGSTWNDAITVTGATSWTSGERKNYSTLTSDAQLSNVKLLVNAEQIPPVDKSPSGRSLTFSGTSARSTTQKKFGTGSLVFDGSTNCYVSAGNPTDFSGTSDFTIEAWVYVTSMASNNRVIFSIDATGPTVGIQLNLYLGGLYYNDFNAGLAAPSAGVITGKWTHIAASRQGNVHRMFVDGAQVSADTMAVSTWTPLYATIGASRVGYLPFDGYIDDLRFTQGVARYTSNFTPPTASFEEYVAPSWVAGQATISVAGQTPTFESYAPLAPVQGTIALIGQTPITNTGYAVSQGTISVLGQQPLLPTYLSPTQATVSLQGQQPQIAPFVIATPTQLAITVTGQNPLLNTAAPEPVILTAVQGSISLLGRTPAFNQAEATADVVGRGFQTLPSILGDYDVSSVSGGTFGTVSKIYGGSLVIGSLFKTTPTLTAIADQTGYVAGRGFLSTPTIENTHDFVSTVQGRGFSSKSTVVGGSIVAGRAFSSPLTATIDAPISLSVTGQGFQTRPTIVAEYQPTMRITGRGFVSGIGYSTVTGRGFAQNAVLKALETSNFAEAFVFNMVPANVEQNLYSVSRYQNYPFQHLTRIANEYYGVKADGLYRLTGGYDAAEDVPVNGTIKLNEDDLSAFNSQNIPYIYLNGDDDYTATAFVDDIEQPAFSSGFNGRRVKLARGSKGRYWYFKIEGIKSLLGVEYRPEKLARKVK